MIDMYMLHKSRKNKARHMQYNKQLTSGFDDALFLAYHTVYDHLNNPIMIVFICEDETKVLCNHISCIILYNRQLTHCILLEVAIIIQKMVMVHYAISLAMCNLLSVIRKEDQNYNSVV